jgi:ADP-heptose:LPS heptosyltransferase
MNQEKPILILQMQRMGDLVLTYPLCGWLAASRPNIPIWLVGEQVFFENMLDISPQLTFFDYSSSDILRQRKFSLIINLSHRREAALLAGALQSEEIIGPYIPAKSNDRAIYIKGVWQLYRTSITQNNRHNNFHWADLNALDLVSVSQMRRTAWPLPKAASRAGANKTVGLFVGASEADKRPDAAFWVGLTNKLLRFGIRPVLLGGKGDKPLADSIAASLKIRELNLCARFSISELSLFMRKLDLLIVPDTGPMHIAAWVNLPVLNLSLGPVNAWETAPFAPNHHVVRPALSCTGCWQCVKTKILCKSKLSASVVSDIARLILENNQSLLSKTDLQGHELYRTDRDEYGLFTMRPLGLHDKACARQKRSLFWKIFFLTALNKIQQNETHAQKLTKLAASLKNPGPMGGKLLTHGQNLLLALSCALRTGTSSAFSADSFWQVYPPVLRLLSSYVQLVLQNANFSRASLQKSIKMVEFFISLLRKN